MGAAPDHPPLFGGGKGTEYSATEVRYESGRVTSAILRSVRYGTVQCLQYVQCVYVLICTCMLVETIQQNASR
jgi:hypothetical protein